LRELEAAGKIAILGSMYDLKTGKVTFMEARAAAAPQR
jgi:hypothetical protein